MGFKMKSGSPFQRNFGVGKSPVKHSGEEYKKQIKREDGFDINDRMKQGHSDDHRNNVVDENHNPVEKEKTEETEATGPKMKSPMKHEDSDWKGNKDNSHNWKHDDNPDWGEDHSGPLGKTGYRSGREAYAAKEGTKEGGPKMKSPMKVAGGVYFPGEGGLEKGEQAGKADQELYIANQKRLQELHDKAEASGQVDMMSWYEKHPNYNKPLVKTGLEQYPDINTIEELDVRIASLGSVKPTEYQGEGAEDLMIDEGEGYTQKGSKWTANNPEDQELLDKLLKIRDHEESTFGREERRKQAILDTQ